MSPGKHKRPTAHSSSDRRHALAAELMRPHNYAHLFVISGLTAFFRPAYQPTHLLFCFFRTYSFSKPAYQPTHLRFFYFRT